MEKQSDRTSGPTAPTTLDISSSLAARIEALGAHPINYGLARNVHRFAEMCLVLGVMDLEQSIDAPIPKYNVTQGCWWLTLRIPDDADRQPAAVREFLRQVVPCLTTEGPRGIALARLLDRLIQMLDGPGFNVPAGEAVAP